MGTFFLSCISFDSFWQFSIQLQSNLQNLFWCHQTLVKFDSLSVGFFFWPIYCRTCLLDCNTINRKTVFFSSLWWENWRLETGSDKGLGWKKKVCVSERTTIDYDKVRFITLHYLLGCKVQPLCRCILGWVYLSSLGEDFGNQGSRSWWPAYLIIDCHSLQYFYYSNSWPVCKTTQFYNASKLL